MATGFITRRGGGGGGGLEIDALIDDFKVSGRALNAGELVEYFNSRIYQNEVAYLTGGSTLRPTITKLDDDTLLVGYRDSNAYPTVKVIKISGSSIAGSTPSFQIGPSFVLRATSERITGILALDSRRVAVHTASSIKIVIISGTNATTETNTATISNSIGDVPTSLVKLDDYRYASIYIASGLRAIIHNIQSNRIVSSTSSSSIDMAGNSVVSAVRVDDNRILVVYRGTSNFLYANVCEFTDSSNPPTINRPTALTVKASTLSRVQIDRLNNTDFIVAYAISNANYLIGLRVPLNTSASVQTFTSEATYEASMNLGADDDLFKVVGLNSSQALILYKDTSNNYPTARYLSISGSTITVGNKVVIESAFADSIISSTKVSENSAFFGFNDSSSRFRGKVITVNSSGIGNIEDIVRPIRKEIEVGPNIPLVLSSGTNPIAATLSENKGILAYIRGSDSYVIARVFDFTENAITYGPEYVVVSAAITAANGIDISNISETKVLLVAGNTSTTYAKTLDISNKVITANTEYTDAISSQALKLSKNTSSQFILTYRLGGVFSLNARLISVSGNVITFENPELIQAPTVGFSNSIRVKDNTFLILYRNISNNSYGTARILSISGSTISVGSAYVFYLNQITINFGISLSRLDDSRILAAYNGFIDNGYKVNVQVFTISGNTLSWGNVNAFGNTVTDTMAVAAINSKTAIVLHHNADKGTSATLLEIIDTTVIVADEWRKINTSGTLTNGSLKAIKLGTKSVLGLYQGLNSYPYIVNLEQILPYTKYLGITKEAGVVGDEIEVYTL
jgi:hypothetical protein